MKLWTSARWLVLSCFWLTAYSTRGCFTHASINKFWDHLRSGFPQVFCSKIQGCPLQSWNDNFSDLIETITLSDKCQKWYTISQGNEIVLMEQYANNKSPGQRGRGQSWNTSSFCTFNGSCKFACFSTFRDAKNHRYLQSAWSKIIFPDFSKIIFFFDPSLTFPDHTNFLTFPVFPDLYEFWSWCWPVSNSAKVCKYSENPRIRVTSATCLNIAENSGPTDYTQKTQILRHTTNC